VVETVCRNLDGCTRADDFPCAQTFRAASQWLRENAGRQPFFLWVETFDPHEPWTPPHEYDLFGDPSYTGKDYVLPPGGTAAQWFSEEEIARIRSLYAGEVAYVDAMVGRLLETVRELHLYENTLIVFLSDHGHPLAEHGKFLKGPDRLYSELLKVPCGMKLPEGEAAGRRCDELGQFSDVLPTILDALGVGQNVPFQRERSLLRLVRGEIEALHDATISGFWGPHDRCVRNKRWSLLLRPGEEADELYDLEQDALEQKNVLGGNLEIAQALLESFGAIYYPAGTASRGVQGHFETEHTAIR
jgi:arylsulfatase A-like enzyme